MRLDTTSLKDSLLSLKPSSIIRFLCLAIGFIFVLFYATVPNLQAQSVIGIHTRHVLNPEDEVRLRENRFTTSFLDFQGIVLSLSRTTEKRLYSFALGFNSTGSVGNISNTPEYFAQIKLRMFKKNLFAKPKSTAFFSVGPRLFFMNGSIAETSVEFASRTWKSGVEVPFIFEFEHYFKKKIRLFLSANVISPLIFANYQEVDNPSINPRGRSNGGVDVRINLFNELRLGIGYVIEKEE